MLNFNKPTKKALVEFFLLILILVLMIAMVVNFKSRDFSYKLYDNSTLEYVDGVVLEVVSQELSREQNPQYATGRQTVRVEILEGKAKGELVEIINYVTPNYQVILEEGSKVIVCADMPEGVEPYFTIYNYDRTFSVGIIAAFFILLVVLVGRKKGIMSCIGLLFTLCMVVCYLVPELFEGNNVVFVLLLTVVSSTFVTCFCISGLSKKTCLNLVSIVAGSASAALMYRVFMALLKISGTTMAESENLLLISYSTDLKLSGVLFAGVTISALGAVMDVAVSMCASLSEIKDLNPSMGSGELFRSGMNIGRDMIGTMTNTLILAFAGGTLASLIIFISYGIQTNQLLSSDFLALELATGIAGSSAVVLTVPISAGVCAIGLGKKINKKRGKHYEKMD